MKSTFASRSSTFVKIGYGVAAVLWAGSLALPAATINESIQLTGYRVFFIGIDALAAGMPGWLANPLAAAAIVAGVLRRLGLATALSVVAVVLTLSSFYAPTLARARGMPIEQVEFKVGFFLWIAACSLILATSFYAFLRSRRAITAL
jgi:hypothetical protein